nr:alpha/beta hydrolase [Actinomycetales bacterium]
MRILDPIPLPVDGAPTALAPANAPDQHRGGQPHGHLHIRNVTVPTITPVLPDQPSGSAVVIAPGGGWHRLSIENEGTRVAEPLAARGMSCFVLHYRLEPTPRGPAGDGWSATQTAAAYPAALDAVAVRARPRGADDGAAALAYVRAHSADWGIDGARVGLLGFSAGGHVALATACDRPEAQPAFVAGIYPVAWDGIMPPEPAPPLFLAWATDDTIGRTIIDSALATYRAWWAAGGEVEAHAYPSGGHGFGAAPKGADSDRWMADFQRWLETRGHLT